MLSCISFKALSDAPFFCVIISIPFSTSLNKDVATIATIVDVTLMDRPLPNSVVLSPTSLILFTAYFIESNKADGAFLLLPEESLGCFPFQ